MELNINVLMVGVLVCFHSVSTCIDYVYAVPVNLSINQIKMTITYKVNNKH